MTRFPETEEVGAELEPGVRIERRGFLFAGLGGLGVGGLGVGGLGLEGLGLGDIDVPDARAGDDTTRPPEKVSIVASMRPRRSGLRYGITSTDVPIITDSVAPASTAMVAISSSSGSMSGAGKAPVGL